MRSRRRRSAASNRRSEGLSAHELVPEVTRAFGNPATTMDDMKGMSTHTSMSMSHTLRRTIGRTVAITAVVGLAVVAAACGSDTKSASLTTAPGANAPGTTGAAGTVSVTKPWARTSPSDATNGAAYFTITSPVDDTLTGVSVDPAVAKMAQMHETSMGGGSTGTTMAGATTTAPQMSMSPVDTIDLKAGTAVEFKPGGYHVMMMGLAKPLKVGDTITLTLTLTKAGTVTVQAPVLDEAP